MLVLLSLLAACGGAATPTTEAPAPTEAVAGGAVAEPTAAGAAAEEPTAAPAGEEPAGEPTPTIDLAASPGGTPVPTPLPTFTCNADQKQIVWMVRNGEPENSWEINVVRPAFEKLHPEICVQIQSFVQDDIAVKREAMLASGEPLHVWSTNWGGNGFASDRARGLIADLTPLIQRDNVDLSVFVPDVLKIYQSEGKTWGLPFLTTGSYVYYNKKLFDEAGVAYPPVDWDDPSWTWDAFVETAKKLTKNTDDINKAQFGASAGIVNDNLEFAPSLFGHDVWPDGAYDSGYADSVSVTDDASKKGFQALHDLVYKDKVAPDPAASSALDQLGGAFAAGRVAMTVSGGWGHWSWHGLIDDPNGFCWGAAPIPAGSPDAKNRTIIFTDPWVLTKDLPADQMDTAWEFVKFLVSPEQAKLYSDTTGTPPTQTALLDGYYKQFEKCQKPEDMKTVFEGAFTHGRESSNHMMVQWDELHQIWVNAYTNFFNDPAATPDQMLQDIESQTNEALKRIKSEGAAQ